MTDGSQVIDVLAAVAREMLDLDARHGGQPLEALTVAVHEDGNQSPYLAAIISYAHDAFLICACGESTADEIFLVHQEVWEDAYDDEQPARNPCLSCFEDALGRDLEPEDFTDDDVNTDPDLRRSPRLQDRLSLPG